MQPLGKSLNEDPFIRKPHSIRLVEIPSTTEVTRGVKLSIENARLSTSFYGATSFPKYVKILISAIIRLSLFNAFTYYAFVSRDEKNENQGRKIPEPA